MPGTITALEVQKRNKERVNVYLDGEYAFSLAMIEAARLRKGQVLSQKEIETLQAADAVERATDIAVKFLSYRPRSTSEIQNHLRKKDLPPIAIESALDRLERLGYVDDLAFTRFWVGNRDEFNPKGPLALRQELRKKGVANALIEQVLDDVDFTDAAYRAALKRVKRWQALPRREFRQKMYAYLARRGFRGETVKDVLHRLIEEFEIQEQDDFDNDVF